ncbi:MAG: hypothetical protein AB1592_11570 [Pseudomonadota bacterium]
MISRALARRAARPRLGEDGLAALDFALIFPAILVLVFALVDVTASALAQGALDHAVGRTAAAIARGTLAPSAGATTLGSEVCDLSALPLLPKDTCSGALLVDVRALNGSAAPAPIVDGALNADAFGTASGSSGDLLLVRAALRVPTFLPAALPFLANLSDGSRLVVSSALTRVDPYAAYNAGGGS